MKRLIAAAPEVLITVALTSILIIAGVGVQLALGALAATALVFISLINERSAWVVFTLAMFTNRFPIPFGPATLRLEHLALLLLVFCLITRRRAGSSRQPQLERLTAAMTVLALWILLSVVTSTINAPEAARSLYIVALYVLAVTAFMVATGERDAAWRVRASTVVLSVMCALSVLSWVMAETFDYATPLVILNSYEDTHRTQGLLFEPNFLGSACAMWLCLLYAYRRTFTSRALLVHTLLLTSALILTLTRAAWLSAILVAVVAVLRTLPRRPGLVVTALSLASASLLAIVTVMPISAREDISARLRGLFDFTSGTGRFRAEGWEVALDQLTSYDAWVFGLGTNSYSQRNVSAFTSSGEGYLGNFWLGLIYDTGIIGFLLIVTALALIANSATRKTEMLLLIGVVGLNSLTTSPLWFAYPWVALALMRHAGTAAALGETGVESGWGRDFRSVYSQRLRSQRHEGVLV